MSEIDVHRPVIGMDRPSEVERIEWDTEPSMVGERITFRVKGAILECLHKEDPIRELVIEGILVEDGLRGKGLAKLLMQAAFNYCLQHRINRVEAIVSSSRLSIQGVKGSRVPHSALIKFYSDLGFDVHSTIENMNEALIENLPQMLKSRYPKTTPSDQPTD